MLRQHLACQKGQPHVLTCSKHFPSQLKPGTGLSLHSCAPPHKIQFYFHISDSLPILSPNNLFTIWSPSHWLSQDLSTGKALQGPSASASAPRQSSVHTDPDRWMSFQYRKYLLCIQAGPSLVCRTARSTHTGVRTAELLLSTGGWAWEYT